MRSVEDCRWHCDGDVNVNEVQRLCFWQSTAQSFTVSADEGVAEGSSLPSNLTFGSRTQNLANTWAPAPCRDAVTMFRMLVAEDAVVRGSAVRSLLAEAAG